VKSAPTWEKEMPPPKSAEDKKFMEYQSQLMKYYIYGKNIEHAPSIKMSAWTAFDAAALNFFFVPVSSLDEIFPSSYLPTNEDERMKNFLIPLLDDQITEESLRGAQWYAKTQPYSLQRKILYDIHFLLKQDEQMLPTFEKIKEDKLERYTDNLFRDVVAMVGYADDTISPFTLAEEEPFKTTLGDQKYTGKVEFVIKKDKLALVFAWIENKRMQFTKPFLDTFAQKVAETISVAMNNYNPTGGSPSFQDQEVFGISVRHHFFTFWHAVIPASYLFRISETTEGLDLGHFVKLKCYPQSAYGLDICDPKEREHIFRVLIGLQNYLADKPRIGFWKSVKEESKKKEIEN